MSGNVDREPIARKRPASSIDVAKAAGISQATVSYVFNGRKGATVPAETREHVLKVAKELGYRPNRSAQSLKTGRTYVIAFWTAQVLTPLFTEVLRFARKAVESDGYEIIISGSLKSGAATHWPVDGILAFDSLFHIQALMREETLQRIPLVSMGPFHLEGVDYVGIDLHSGAREAMRHLVAETGRKKRSRRIAYLVEDRSNNSGEHRHQAYHEVMDEAGLSPEIILASGQTRLAAREDIKLYIDKNGVPDAVFCMNDELAIGALRGFCDQGISVPEEVKLVGCDGIEETAYHIPSISTIVQPLEEMCALGWEFLHNRLQDEAQPRQQVTLKPHLAIRESSVAQRKNPGRE